MVVDVREAQLYPSGGVFIKYSPDGGSFAYYPSGNMAMAYERMGSGFYAYFYADNRSGTTLLAIDPSGEGFCAFPNGRPRLTTRKQGGTYSDENGNILRLWTTQKPLDAKRPIEFDLTPSVHVSFGSRQQIKVRLTCGGMSEEWQIGELQKMATDSYLSKSLGTIKMGPERGKVILDIDRCREAARANQERRAAMGGTSDIPVAKTHVTEDDMRKHPELRPIVGSTASLRQSVADGAWDVDVFIAKEKLAATLGDSFPTLRLGDDLRGDPHSRTLASLPSSKPAVLAALLTEHDGQGVGGPLALSQSIKAASGRYRPEHGLHYKTPRKRLPTLTEATYDQYVKHDAPRGQVVVVACLAGWLPAARRAEANLEMLHGALTAKKGEPTENWSQTMSPPPASSGMHAAGMHAAGARTPTFALRKFDMSHSRLLRERHNIVTLPAYLMYVDGRLVYASPTLNGTGTSVDDLLKQVEAASAAASRGAFLPDDYQLSNNGARTS